MTKSVPSSSHFSGVSIQLVPRSKRRKIATKFQVSPIDHENLKQRDDLLDRSNQTTASASNIETNPNSLNNDEKSFLSEPKETSKSSQNVSNLTVNRPFQENVFWKYPLMIIHSVCTTLLLIIYLLPFIFIYLAVSRYVPKQATISSVNITHCAGISSTSNWKTLDNDSITMNIDTSECQFDQTPFYFVSIAGTSMHYCLTGYAAIYSPTQQSFQINTHYACGTWNSSTLLSAAQSYDWNANWMGFI